MNNQFNPNFNQAPVQQGRLLNIMLVPDIGQIDGYQINPGGSMLFMDEGMKNILLKSRDQNGFPLPDRTWSIKETTPPASSNSPYASKEEVSAINAKLDQVISSLNELLK